MKELVFFTFNDFSIDGGGRIRIYGILNALAKQNKYKIILISNAKDKNKFDNNIKHIYLDANMNSFQKKLFQFSIAVFPNFINKMLFKKLLLKFEENVPENYKSNIIFFEYLDNTFGYFLKKNKIINNYINDIHGIAPLEFYYNKSKGIKFIYNRIRYIIAEILDRKLMADAYKIISVSNAMKNYFLKKYKFLNNEKILVVRDGVSKDFCSQKIDEDLLEELKKKYKNDNKKIIFFAGNFKDLGGVLDLVYAFLNLLNIRNDIKLILIGKGEHFDKIQKIVKKLRLDDKIILLGIVPYNKLKTYQQLADVIVCPDKKHPYSELIIHIKYFDSLASGKVVINGNFKSVKEINKNERLSVDFEPSNIEDLSNKINLVLNDIKFFEEKYKDNPKIVCNEFTYEKFIDNVFEKI